MKTSFIFAATVCAFALATVVAPAQDVPKAATLWADLDGVLPRRGTNVTTNVQVSTPPSAAIDWAKADSDMVALMVRARETPVEPYAMFYLATIKLEQGVFDEALSLLESVKKNFPKHPLVTLKLTKTGGSQIDEAISDVARDIQARAASKRTPIPTPVLNTKVTATIHFTTGDVKVQFYDNVTPKHAARFMECVKTAVYNRTKIGRIVADNSITVGDTKTREEDGGKVQEADAKLQPIPQEAAFLSHQRGMLSMLRNPVTMESDPTQFQFILKDAPQLDFSQTIFGKVVDGIAVIDAISRQMKNQYDTPVAKILILGIDVTETK